MTDARVAVGVDIGGTKVLGALVDEHGAILREHRVPSPKDWPSMRDAIVAVVAELGAGDAELRALGVGAAGMVDLDGVIHYAPNVPGFRTVAVRAALAEATGLPTVVDNDANTAAYAELRFGVAKGLQDAMVITLGTGIGGGIIVDGRVLRGANGFAAEVGHFQIDPLGPMCACGERGHWEAMASGNALGRMARETAAAGEAPVLLERAGGSIAAIDGHFVSGAAHAGVPEALALVDRYSFSVAIGLVGLANIFDPAVIGISGGVVNDEALFLEPIRRHFLGHIEGAEYRPTPEIVPAALGERAGVIGAAVLALDRFGARGVRLGLTLPSFVADPEAPLAVAIAADAAGLDGVFAFDHLFRTAASGELRPALECTALLGTVAAATERVAVGTLVARATLRPPATLAAALDTVVRIAGPRLLVGLGAGDTESRAEMETFGLPFGTEADRIMALRATLRVVRDRGYPIWVGGRARHVGLVAAESADGWNRWGASVDVFTRELEEVRAMVERLARAPVGFIPSWGGLVLVGRTEAEAEAKRAKRDPAPGVIVGGPERVAEKLRPYLEAGAEWLIVGPLDSSDPENATILGEQVLPLLA